jgi:hypothetical protein
MTRTTPRRRMTLHFTQIFFTDARTFTVHPLCSFAAGTFPKRKPAASKGRQSRVRISKARKRCKKNELTPGLS